MKPNNKDLSSIVDYNKIVNKIILLVESQHHELLEDLAENIFVGIHNFEKKKRQRVKFNIEILTNPYVFPNNKDLKSIINYEEIVYKIEKLSNLKHHELLEDLSENIFNMLFQNKLVKKVNLKIEKIDIIKKTKSVGIEVSKLRV